MTILRQMKYLAVLGLAMPLSLPAAQADAQQKFFQRQQIIQQLQLPSNGQVQRRRAPQQNGQIVRRKRAPQPNGAVVMRRAPQPQGGVKTFRAPQPQGDVAKFRAPPPRNEGPIVQEFRAPAPNGRVATRRAPQPDNGNVAKSRPPTVKRRAPSRVTVDNGNRKIASNDPNAGVRGLDIRQNVNTSDYPESGRLDLEILFEYDSARINPDSVRQLVALGEALNDPELGDSRFMIAGHTDAAGSYGYNADLSLRRAFAVSQFLVDFVGVKADRLVTEGYGEELLKFPDAPESGQNRRVEIINLGG